MLRLSKEEISQVMQEKLVKHGVPGNVAADCAGLLVENSIDAYRPGKLSHEKDT